MGRHSFPNPVPHKFPGPRHGKPGCLTSLISWPVRFFIVAAVILVPVFYGTYHAHASTVSPAVSATLSCATGNFYLKNAVGETYFYDNGTGGVLETRASTHTNYCAHASSINNTQLRQAGTNLCLQWNQTHRQIWRATCRTGYTPQEWSVFQAGAWQNAYLGSGQCLDVDTIGAAVSNETCDINDINEVWQVINT